MSTRKLVRRFFLSCLGVLILHYIYFSCSHGGVWALCVSESVFMMVHMPVCTHITPQPHSSPLHYQIYCKAALWKSTHALPSLCTAPWQLLLYIPLQMRAMNWRDYRVEQKQWGKRGGGVGGRKSKASWERRGEAIQEEVIEVCCKLYCSSFINHSVWDKLCFSLKCFLVERVKMRLQGWEACRGCAAIVKIMTSVCILRLNKLHRRDVSVRIVDTAEVTKTFGNKVLPSSGGDGNQINGTWMSSEWDHSLKCGYALSTVAIKFKQNKTQKEENNIWHIHPDTRRQLPYFSIHLSRPPVAAQRSACHFSWVTGCCQSQGCPDSPIASARLSHDIRLP